MKVTIEDVARQAGGSKATVSRIINRNYTQSTEETRERVLRVIQELNYQPNMLAKGLKQMKTNTIGIVLSNLKNPFWIRVLEGVEDTCREYGYSLMICNSNEDGTTERELIRGLRHRKVDGLVVNPTADNRAFFEELSGDKYPFVLMNRKVEKVRTDSVVVDNRLGAQLAVEHLLRLGRRRFAAFAYPYQGISTWQERIGGFREALLAAGLSEADFSVTIVDQREGAAKEAVGELLDALRPDAVFSTNNMLTLELMEGIKEAGKSIPEDIALVGYDETVWSKHLQPPLTTVYQPGHEMGALAAETLFKRIVSKKTKRSSVAVLKPTLIVRRSCGAAAAEPLTKEGDAN